MATSLQIARARGVQGGPELRVAARSELEVAREHADDGVRDPAERERLPYGVLISAEPCLPCSVAEDDRPCRARQVLSRLEIAAEDRGDSKDPEEAVTDPGARGDLNARGRAQEVRPPVVDLQRCEDRVCPLPVQIVRVREVRAGNLLGYSP